jgi:hypothetical protein
MLLLMMKQQIHFLLEEMLQELFFLSKASVLLTDKNYQEFGLYLFQIDQISLMMEMI